jgi:ferredoxin-NADP reductase
MLKLIDNFLNRITMDRLVLYFLMLLVLQGAIFGAFHIVRFGFFEVLISALVLLITGWAANGLLAKIFNVPANVESVYITALILTLIISPAQTLHDYLFLIFACILAMASKFVLSINKKHIFNPAAVAVVITSYALADYASWWVGTEWMLPLVLVGGFLIVRKVRTWDMVFTFLAVMTITTLSFSFFRGTSVTLIFKQAILDSPLFFFAFIMLTEPLTAPPSKGLQNIYAGIVGFLFAPQVHILSIYFSPEMALCVGNIFAYVVSPKEKLLLILKEKIKLSADTYNFIFTSDRPIKFKAGQYLEWTLKPVKPDDRGNRRYFTIASSPTEKEIIIGVKFYEPASTFKQSLLAMASGSKMLAGQLAGDFTLPKDQNQKLVFIAGGIGITPFRSMIKYLIDQNEKRNIIFFYANKSPNDIVYKEILDDAQTKLGIKTIYTVSKKSSNQAWDGETGYIDAAMIKSKVPDYKERMFYISGAHSMIENFKQTLSDLGIKSSHIKTDFFPGFV